KGFCPTSWKLLDVPGMAGGMPGVATARDGAAVTAATIAAAAGSASRSLERMIPPHRSDLPPLVRDLFPPSSSPRLHPERPGAFPPTGLSVPPSHLYMTDRTSATFRRASDSTAAG